MTRVNRDTVVAILLLVGCGVLLNASFDIREPDYGQLSPATWPRTLIAILTLLSLIYLMQSIRRGAPAEPVEKVKRSFGKWIVHWRNIFFVFALQCMSTVAIMRRETAGWKWPVLQFSDMLGLAYLGALAANHLL